MSTDEEVPLATRQMHEAFVTISQQMLQFRVNTARITTPSDYEPQEVWVIYETLECPDQRQYMRSRGLVSRNKLWMLMETETDKDWKYFTHIFSDDCKVCVFVAESIEMGHDKDVIQVEDVQYKKAKFTVALVKYVYHGPIIVTGPNAHFKLSRNNKKLLYFALPNEEQKETQGRGERQFVICIFDFDAKGVTVITDENICNQTITAVEWTPDGRGIVFHRGQDLLWHRFGEKYINEISTNLSAPLRITFSPDESRMAVFLRPNIHNDADIILFHYPFVKAAVQVRHDVLRLGKSKVWSVPDRPWACNGKHLLFNTNYKNQVNNLAIHVESLRTTCLDLKRPSLIIDVRGDEFLFETITANAYSRLWHSQLGSQSDGKFTASLLCTHKPENDTIHNFHIYPMSFQKIGNSAILYMLPECVSPGSKFPLVVVPFSGLEPNFTVSTVDPVLSTMVTCGFCVLVVNYREPFIAIPGTCFPKNCGSECINDETVLEVLERHGARLDEKYIYLYGFEFGSFVACSLIIKHKKFYKGCALVRPMLEFPFTTCAVDTENPEAEFLKDVEPVSHASEIVTPMLIVLENKSDTKYKDFESTIHNNGVPCFGEYEEEDEQVNDFVVKVIQFYRTPYGEYENGSRIETPVPDD